MQVTALLLPTIPAAYDTVRAVRCRMYQRTTLRHGVQKFVPH